MSDSAPPGELAGEITHLLELIQEWQALFPQAAEQAGHWRHVLAEVQAHLAEEVVRVAVVGAVKSGKSTLVNALMGREVLKRGAGILTAMITRVRPGPEERALLLFKAPEVIAGEIQQALNFLPDARLENHPEPFTLSRPQDRELLAQILAGQEAASLWANGSLNQNYVLLTAYLAGYGRVEEALARGSLELCGPDVERHQELVTQEELAVYLADALLTLPAADLPPFLELGDCQGSDSPLPQHLTQVLAYLLKCDLALYVISSRMGLRQADFQFLQELRRMGMGEHLIFVLNLDLGDHRDAADCEALIARVRRELAPWVPKPRLCAFSALQVLLERRREAGGLAPQEEAFLALVQGDPGKSELSRRGWEEFQGLFRQAVEGVRAGRLAGGALPQVLMVAKGLAEQVDWARRLLDRDAGAYRELAARLQARRQPLTAVRASLHQTLEGATRHLGAELKHRVDAFLSEQGSREASLVSFVLTYEPDWERLLADEPAAPLRHQLYRLFQEFQQELLKLAGGEFNLQVVEFVRRQEEWLRQELHRLCEPLVVALEETLALYYRETAALGLPGEPPSLKLEVPPRPPKLEVPLLSLALEPGWRWAGEVWLRSGMGVLERLWQRLKAKAGWGSLDPRQQAEQDLRRALAAIRRWVREELKVQLVDFGERLKFRYFLPLVAELAQGLEEGLERQLKSLLVDLEGLTQALSHGEADREGRRRRLDALAPRVRLVEARLTSLAAQVNGG